MAHISISAHIWLRNWLQRSINCLDLPMSLNAFLLSKPRVVDELRDLVGNVCQMRAKCVRIAMCGPSTSPGTQNKVHRLAKKSRPINDWQTPQPVILNGTIPSHKDGVFA